MDRYRVFISYSHDNKQDVELLAEVLRKNDLTPIYDIHIPGGHDFDAVIKKYIAHAHVFMPLITAESAARGWVHEEIGYAMALNIPVLPVSKEKLPDAMIQKLHAITLDDNLSNAKEKLDYSVFDNLVGSCSLEKSTYYCTEQPEERAQMMAKMADDVRSMGFTGLLRQRGGLSSFQIPNKPSSDRIWTERFDTVLKNDFHCKCQLAERKALEAHARAEGCRLVINPQLICEKYSKIAQRARLGTFLDFLRSMPQDKIDIAIDNNLDFNESITIVGDWFSAESYYRSESQGFKQTIFTCHAPGIKSKIDTFDSEFESLLLSNGTSMGDSLNDAVAYIEELIQDIV